MFKYYLMGKENTDLEIREAKNIISVHSVRLILLDRIGDYYLVRYGNTNWLGLPGGRINHKESRTEENLLSIGAYLTLMREYFEETGIALDLIREKTFCIGMVDGVIAQKNVGAKITRYESSVFLSRVATLPITHNPNVVVANIYQMHPGPLFPDARLAIGRVRELIGGARYEGPELLLLPQVNGVVRDIRFQMSPYPVYVF